MLERLKSWAKIIKRDVITLWFCCKREDVPLVPKLLAAAVVAYALSPIDLIPDFVPVLGYLDDLILLPLGIYLAVRLIPQAVLVQCREQAHEWFEEKKQKPRSYAGAVLIILIWGLLTWLVWSAFAEDVGTFISP